MFRVFASITPVMENQMEESMEHETVPKRMG